jgi:hypothetical protein
VELVHTAVQENRMGKRSFMGYFVHRKWTAMNIRAGKYKEIGTKSKNKCYENVIIYFTREEFKNWCYQNEEKIRSMIKPSIDRIDSTKGYSLDNITILELNDNIIKKRFGCNYVNGPKSNTLRGIKKNSKSSTYSARITIDKVSLYLGSFKTKKEAYLAFHSKYKEFHGTEPFDLSKL